MPRKGQADIPVMTGIKAGLLSLSAAALLASCHRLPEGVMDEKELSSLLADMQIAEAYYMVEGMPGTQRSGMVDQDSVKKAIRQQILLHHNVTQKEFETTLDWYGHNIDRYEDVCDLTVKNLEDKNRKYAASSVSSANVNEAKGLWPSSLFIGMGGHTGRKEIAFAIKAKTIRKGERLLWNFRTISLTPPLDAVMAVDYTDGSTSLISHKIMSEGRQSISLQTDSTLTPALVYGYVRHNAGNLLLLDSISLMAEPASPSKYYGIYRQKYLPAPPESVSKDKAKSSTSSNTRHKQP